MLSDGTRLREITRRIVDLERRERLRMCEWLALVAEFDRGAGASRTGFRSTAEWLAFHCDLVPRTARDHVRVARRLAEMPKVADAFGEGRLSYAQVRALTRAHESEDEAALLQIALTSTAAQLERHIRQLRSSPSADRETARRAHARRFLTHFWDEDGSLRFFGQFGADDGAAFAEAIETAAEVIHGESDPCCDEPSGRPSLAARRADALVDLVTGGHVRTHLVLHADPKALACEAADRAMRAGNVCALSDGPAIPSELARRLTCDAEISVRGLNLGRVTRTVTPRQRRALEARDGRMCAMPGCERAHGLDAHHIVHWIHGGRTDLDNLVLLCRFHHRLFHDDGWRLRRRGNGTLAIKTPRGSELHSLPSRASPALPVAA